MPTSTNNPIIPGCYDAKSLQPKRRLIASVGGEDKQGKSHFACTAPGPIVYINMDNGVEGVVEKFRDSKSIQIADIFFTGEKASYEAAWGKFKTVYDAALHHNLIRSVVIDTGTQLWELTRLKHFGQLSGVMPTRYEKPNAEFSSSIIDAAFQSDKNVIILHKFGKEYINNTYTGGQAIKCFGDMGGAVQINIKVKRDGKNGPFGLIVENCRHNKDIAGFELTEPMCSFPFLAAEVFGSGLDEWE